MQKVKNMFHRKSKEKTYTGPTRPAAARTVETVSTTTESQGVAPPGIQANVPGGTRSVLPPPSGPVTSTTSTSTASPMTSTAVPFTSGGHTQTSVQPSIAPTTYSPAFTSSGQGFASERSSTQYMTGQGQTTTSVQQPTVEVIQKQAVVQEQIQEFERDVIQPVITRQREQTEIRQITQPMHQRSVLPTVVEEVTLQPEIRPEIREQPRQMIPQVTLQSSSRVAPGIREVVQEQPLIQETVKRQVLEEVQPIIYRETVIPRVVHEVRPIYERIVEAPIILMEERQPISLPPNQMFQSSLGQQPKFMGGQGMMGSGAPMLSTTNFAQKQFPTTSAPLSASSGPGLVTTESTTTTTTTAPVNKQL